MDGSLPLSRVKIGGTQNQIHMGLILVRGACLLSSETGYRCSESSIFQEGIPSLSFLLFRGLRGRQKRARNVWKSFLSARQIRFACEKLLFFFVYFLWKTRSQISLQFGCEGICVFGAATCGRFTSL